MLKHEIEYWDKKKTKKKYEYWWLNGKLHREDGPAYIQYWDNGEVMYEGWWINDKYHREDGPAIIWYREGGDIIHEEWCLNGKMLSKEEIEEIKAGLEVDKCIEELLC